MASARPADPTGWCCELATETLRVRTESPTTAADCFAGRRRAQFSDTSTIGRSDPWRGLPRALGGAARLTGPTIELDESFSEPCGVGRGLIGLPLLPGRFAFELAKASSLRLLSSPRRPRDIALYRRAFRLRRDIAFHPAVF